MSENIGDLPISVERRQAGPYIRAVFNPDSAKFQEMLDSSSRTVLDIGCGKQPRVSWRLGPRDLWVGCDPLIKNDESTILVHKGERTIKPGAGLIVFPYASSDLPKFTPDVFSAVAPNQKDIVDNKIFNTQLTSFLSTRKQQTFVITLDTRTVEASGYQREAIQKISLWMNVNRFARDPENEALERFSPNSADLGAKNIKLCFVRNSKI